MLHSWILPGLRRALRTPCRSIGSEHPWRVKREPGRRAPIRPPRNVRCSCRRPVSGLVRRDARASRVRRLPVGFGPTVASVARPCSLTVAGAAQELGPLARCRTCFPFNHCRVNWQRHLNGAKYSPKGPRKRPAKGTLTPPAGRPRVLRSSVKRGRSVPAKQHSLPTAGD